MSPRVIPKTPAPAEQRRQELAEANARIEGAFRQAPTAPIPLAATAS